MTAEIVILNQQAVALAADSALTIGKQRVWKHANKLFSAGPQHDIGVMIYNSGDFLSVPWEIIIKEHRKSIINENFLTLSQFVDSFINFVKLEKFGGQSFEELSFGLIISDIIDSLDEDIEFKDRPELQRKLLLAIKAEMAALQDVRALPHGLTFAKFKKNYGKVIKDLAIDTFEIGIRKFVLNELIALVFEHITRESRSGYSTGIVIAGYGREELFPVVQNIYVDGRSMGLTRVWKATPAMNLNTSRSQNAAIMPFAQIDMARLFMEGISSKYVAFMTETLKASLINKTNEIIDGFIQDEGIKTVEKILQEKQIEAMAQTFEQEFAHYRAAEFSKPILDTIRALPKEEMAYMARAMVEITALRRRFASAVESVGGDIDVAVISKSDGFIWIHRKHYFDLDSNPDFMQRRENNRGG